MKAEDEIQEIENTGNPEDFSTLEDATEVATDDSPEESRDIVPYKSADLSPSTSGVVGQSWHIWMLGAVAITATILGATLYATAKDSILQKSQPEEPPTSSRFLDWNFFWNNAETLPSNHDARQLMEYLFFILLGYCGSEMFSHLIHNELNLNLFH